MSDHLDLDALADALADGDSGGDIGGDPHLVGCAACQSRLAELAAAMPEVSQSLAGLPLPSPPSDLEDRLLSALALEAAPPARTAEILPFASRRARWMPALGAVAAAAVLVTGGVLIAQGGSTRTVTNDASGSGPYAVNSSGTDYTAEPGSLSAALPALLAGRATAGAQDLAAPLPTNTQAKRSSDPEVAAAQSAPGYVDPLAALRATDGLARCLASLADPGQSGLPLALDYASFQGTPALVVVLPSNKADKVDVFVVPAGCSEADGQVLYFTRLPKP